MPANLTPQYLKAEERFKSTSSHSDKISALEEMLRAIPKHKGTEKMQGELKRRLSRLRKESQKKKATVSQKPFYYIEREGAGQAILCGPANAGKSQLLCNLTHAQPEVGDYPFTTRAPLPGMMAYQDIQIQLVDTPPLAPETLEPWQLAMISQADVVVLLFDVNDPNVLEQTEFILTIFEEKELKVDDQQHPPVVALGNKIDRDGAKENFNAWQELFGAKLQARQFCALRKADLEMMRDQLFKALKIVRVYTKVPGKKRENTPPYVLKRGSSVLDLASNVHKTLATSFKFARVWGQATFDGQLVEQNYVLQDRDLVEIHG